MVTANKPTVSIGLPVYNGEDFLEETLKSILTQTYQNFELIISDNASTDSTQQICKTYASKDTRIRYYRYKNNVGASRNFNRVFELAKGKYFKWSSHDDLISKDFLAKTVDFLDTHHDIVLCYSKTGHLNENGEQIDSYSPNCRVDSKKPCIRFGDLISMRFPSWVIIFGLMRTEAIKKTQLFGNYIGVDRNLLAEIALTGPFHELDEYLFFRREHKQAYSNREYKNYHEQLDWWVKNSTPNRLFFPNWRILLEYFKSVKRMPMKFTEKQHCYIEIWKWLLREGWVLMAWDVGINLLERSKYKKRLAPMKKFFVKHGGL